MTYSNWARQLKRIYILIAIVAGGAAFAIAYGYSLSPRADRSECLRNALENNRWEFCGTIPVPVMTMVVLKENASSIAQSEGQYGDRLGMDCDDIPNCDVFIQSRVLPAGFARLNKSDLIFVAEGNYQPSSMTIKVQQISMTNDSAGGNGIDNITDTSLVLTKHPVSLDGISQPSFRYSTDRLPDGNFVLNVISNWDKHTLQEGEITSLHRFIIQKIGE